MSILVRSDGTQFIMQAYREKLSAKNRSQAVHEIRLLAEQHGQYAHLSNKGSGHYSAVFSTDPGCLLGESVWHYFNDPENLIFCEALPDSAKVVLVVVCQSSIYCDKKILASSLQSELLPLMTGDLKYRIITSGNVPLRKAESFGTFRFPKLLIESFETLEEPLLPRLPALKSLQLQPLPLVLRTEHLNFSMSTSMIIVLVITFALGAWWLAPNKKLSAIDQANIQEITNSYEPYYRALSSPAPDQILVELAEVLEPLYALPGWQISSVVYAKHHYAITFNADGGTMGYLWSWAKEHHYRFALDSSGAELNYPSQLSMRPQYQTIYPSQEVVVALVDRLNQLLQKEAVHVGETQQRGAAQETQLTLHVEGISPDLLVLISRQFYALPVDIESIKLHVRSGLLSGNIQLSVWGNK